MSSIWKHLQRVNKKAYRFQYTVSCNELQVVTTSKWQPTQLSIVWKKGNRKFMTEPIKWEPTAEDILKGVMVWSVPENMVAPITLFGDTKLNDLEDKISTFSLIDAPSNRTLAEGNLNMKAFADTLPTQKEVDLNMRVTSHKIKSALLSLTVSCAFLRELASEGDFQSLSSLLSSANTAASDVARLDDFETMDVSVSSEELWTQPPNSKRVITETSDDRANVQPASIERTQMNALREASASKIVECAEQQSGNVISRPPDTNDPIASEFYSLEEQHTKIDEQAADLQHKIVWLREGTYVGPETEDLLMEQFTALVMKKNAIIKRQMQLNIMKKEQDLQRRWCLLEQQVREILVVDEEDKTEEQRLHENRLIEQMVEIVNQRDELVENWDMLEKFMQEDVSVQRYFESVGWGTDRRSCSVQ